MNAFTPNAWQCPSEIFVTMWKLVAILAWRVETKWNFLRFFRQSPIRWAACTALSSNKFSLLDIHDSQAQPLRALSTPAPYQFRR